MLSENKLSVRSSVLVCSRAKRTEGNATALLRKMKIDRIQRLRELADVRSCERERERERLCAYQAFCILAYARESFIHSLIHPPCGFREPTS